jgi:hypothetical protein
LNFVMRTANVLFPRPEMCLIPLKILKH